MQTKETVLSSVKVSPHHHYSRALPPLYHGKERLVYYFNLAPLICLRNSFNAKLSKPTSNSVLICYRS